MEFAYLARALICVQKNYTLYIKERREYYYMRDDIIQYFIILV
jgi:hypothetical protein